MDESNIFKLNSKREKTVEEIDLGGEEPLKIVRIHNVYENPEAVREVFLSAPHTLIPRATGVAPWFSARFIADIREIYGDIIRAIKSELNPKFKPPYRPPLSSSKNTRYSQTVNRKVFDENISTAIDNYIEGCPLLHMEKFLSWQNKKKVYNDIMYGPRTWDRPHADPDYYACSIWLNDQTTCQGGTGFYKHRSTGVTSLEELQKLFVEKDQHYIENLIRTFHDDEIGQTDKKLISDSNDKWELKHIEKMEFNTAVLYNGNFFHTDYLKEGMFKEHYRLSQVIFVPDKVKSLSALGPSTEKILKDIMFKNIDDSKLARFDENHAFTYTE